MALMHVLGDELHHRGFERRAQAVRFDGDTREQVRVRCRVECRRGRGGCRIRPLWRQMVEFGGWFGSSYVGGQASGVDDCCI